METDQMASSANEFQAIIKNIDSEISRLQTLIVGEDDKMIRYKVGYGTFSWWIMNLLEQNKITLLHVLHAVLKKAVNQCYKSQNQYGSNNRPLWVCFCPYFRSCDATLRVLSFGFT